MNSRLVAAKIIYRVLNEGQSLTAALDQTVQDPVSPQDKAFIQAVCYGVIRQFYKLDFILGLLLTKPLKDTEIKALALVGLYQLKYMRVKAHAAVSETVSAIPRKKSWAKPLINALLRRYQRQQEQLEAQADKHPVASLNHPDWMIERIRSNWPEQAQQIILENNQQAPMALRVNLARISRSRYLQRLAEQQIAAAEINECRAAVLLDQAVPVERLPGFADGLVSVQDGSAQLAAELLDAGPGHRVLDVCAAPGGKAAHILEIQPMLKELVAVDIDEHRMRRVIENLQRLNLTATLIVADAAKPESWWNGRLFDRILIDAPCSGLGVIRRHPDIKLLRKPGDIAPLQTLQKTILEAVWPLLAPGGVLLYATCSILKQENENRIEEFLKERRDAAEWRIDRSWGQSCAFGRQILTGQAAMDGFYYARIRKL